MHIKFHSTDSGFCRAYFKTEKGSIICVQDEGNQGYKVYLCTSEGEPNYTIKLNGMTFDRIPDDSKFFSDMNDWMNRRGMGGCIMAYALYKHDEVICRGSLTKVWDQALEAAGDVSVVEFSRQGYSIEPIRITAAGRMQ